MSKNNVDNIYDDTMVDEETNIEQSTDEVDSKKKENNTEKEEKKEEKYDIKQNIGDMFESMGKIMTSIGKSIKNNNMDINSALDQVRSFTSMDPSKLQNVKPQEMVKMMQNKNTYNEGNKPDISKKGTETKARQTKDTETNRKKNKKKTGGSDVNEVFAVFKKITEPLSKLYGTRGRSQIDVTRKMLDKDQSAKKGGSKRKTRRR